jgi:hypothetical protein
MGVKNAEFDADFKSVEQVVKSSYKKVISSKMQELCSISPFSIVHKSS